MKWIAGSLLMAALGLPAWAQDVPPPAPMLLRHAPTEPDQFCYYNGKPYWAGSPYPGAARRARGRQMRCETSNQKANGYTLLEWADGR